MSDRGAALDWSGRAPGRWWYAAMMGVALCLASLTRAQVLADWDSWDYAWMAMRRRPSGLCLGRWWFIFLMRISWQVGGWLGLEAQRAFVAMQWGVALAGVAGVGVAMRWIWEMTGHRWAALLGAVCILVSPSLIAYLSSVMTEGPTLLFLALTLLAWHRASSRSQEPLGQVGGNACLAGACFAVTVSMREPALLLGFWPLLDCLVFRRRGKWRLLVLAVVTFCLGMATAVLMAYRWSGDHPLAVLARYSAYMRQERQMYGFTPWANLSYLVVHFATASPVGFVAMVLSGLLGLWRVIGKRLGGLELRRAAGPIVSGRLWLLAVSTLGYVLLSWYNPNLSFNYRLLLPLAWVLSPLMGMLAAEHGRRILLWWQGRRWGLRRVLAVLAGVVLAGAIGFGSWKRLSYHWASLERNHRLYEAMLELPETCAVFPGPGSAIGLYLEHGGQRPFWLVYPNVQEEVRSWTRQELRRRVEWLRELGVPVYVKAGREGWTRSDEIGPEWRAIGPLLGRCRTRPGPGPFVELMGFREPAEAPADPGRPKEGP